MTKPNNISANIKQWHSLTEIPETAKINLSENINDTKSDRKNSGLSLPTNPYLQGVSVNLVKIIWDILAYLYSSISVRIKRLGLSARAFENAKYEGLEKGLIIESSAGQIVYLIPAEKTFEAFNMPCPYQRKVSVEHSFYVGLGCFLLEKDPSCKSVKPEVKLGTSGAASDIVTTLNDGTRQAYEVTLSTTNILSNLTKYTDTAFTKIIFLCRDYKLREAVKACCREGRIDPELLMKVDYMHFGHLLQRQRKMSTY